MTVHGKDAVLFLVVLALVILCAGSPDLLDAIVHRVMECKP